MKLTSPFTILRDAFQDKAPLSTICFIDETQVALEECGFQVEGKTEGSKLDFWDEECEEHPTNSHCKVFDE